MPEVAQESGSISSKSLWIWGTAAAILAAANVLATLYQAGQLDDFFLNESTVEPDEALVKFYITFECPELGNIVHSWQEQLNDEKDPEEINWIKLIIASIIEAMKRKGCMN